MSLEARIASRLAALTPVDLPEEAILAAKVCLIDALAVSAAARVLEPATAPFAALAAGTSGPSSLIGGGTAPPGLAALANGALAHALDFEDTHDAGVHPNAALVPAVLALAEAEGSTDDNVLLALVTGCDLSIRLTLALAADPATRGWYHPPMVAGIGAAFGCARLMNLPPEGIVDAVSLAAAQFFLTDELKRSPDSHLRATREGLAARAAVEGALLARAGAKGTLLPLTGPAGLFPMLTGRGPREEALTGPFLGPEVGLKLWPCCRGTHPFVALALRLQGQDLRAMRVRVRPPDDMLFRPEADRLRPASAIAAKFSIPFTVAATLRHGAPTLGTFEAAARTDPDTLALAERITLAEVCPDADVGAEVDTPQGTTWHPAPMPRAPRADADGLAAIHAKLTDCLARAGSPMTAETLAQAILAAGGSDDTLAGRIAAL